MIINYVSSNRYAGVEKIVSYVSRHPFDNTFKRIELKSHGLSMTMNVYKDGLIGYSSYRRSGGCYGRTYNIDDNFDPKDFRSNVAAAYFLRNNSTINPDVLKFVVQTMTNFVTESRYPRYFACKITPRVLLYGLVHKFAVRGKIYFHTQLQY